MWKAIFVFEDIFVVWYVCVMKKARIRTKKEAFFVKKWNTKVSTIEKKYGVDLGVRSDMKLGNYLKKKGYKSLSDMLKR